MIDDENNKVDIAAIVRKTLEAFDPWMTNLNPSPEETLAAAQAAKNFGNTELAELLMEQYKNQTATERLLQEIREQAQADATELSQDPNNPIFADWDVFDLAEVARMAREVKKTYGVQLIVKPEIRAKKAGRPDNDGYKRAFWRIYVTKEHNTRQAFELYLNEEQIEPIDALDYDTRYENFKQAMKRERKRNK